METEIIKYTLQKFFDGETCLDDERLLREYFGGNDVDEELLPYRDLFVGLDELSVSENRLSPDDLMDFIMEAEHQAKNKYRRLWQAVSGIAAALILAFMLFNYYDDRPAWKDTYSDPEQAYAEAVHALHFVAGKYQKGLAQLQPVQKLNDATEPMHNGICLLDKGFREMEPLAKISKKLKTE